jgi:hypothetical protein
VWEYSCRYQGGVYTPAEKERSSSKRIYPSSLFYISNLKFFEEKTIIKANMVKC